MKRLRTSSRRPGWRLAFLQLEDRNAPSDSLGALLGGGFLPDVSADGAFPPPAVGSDGGFGSTSPAGFAAGEPEGEPLTWLGGTATTLPGFTPSTASGSDTGYTPNESDWLDELQIRTVMPYIGVSAPADAAPAGSDAGGSAASSAPAGTGAPADPGTFTPAPTGGPTLLNEGESDGGDGWQSDLASGLKVTVSGTNAYTIDRNGYSPEEWKEIVSSSDHTVNPFTVSVDLTVTVTNTSDRALTLLTQGGVPSYIDLELRGPGAVTTPRFTGGFQDFDWFGTTLQPGESRSVSVTKLWDVRSGSAEDGANGVLQYWTEAGEYELVATLRTGVTTDAEAPIFNQIKAAVEGVEFEPIEVSSDPFAITVTEPTADPGHPICPPGWPWEPPICSLPIPPEVATDKLSVTISGTDTYALNLGGLTEEQFQTAYREYLDYGWWFMPPVPQVDLTVAVTNTDDEPVTFWNAGDPVRIELGLSGEGAVTLNPPVIKLMYWHAPSSVTLAPGESYAIPITQLSGGFRGGSIYSYWSEPGEYELTATLHTAIATAAPGSDPAPVFYQNVIATSTPFGVTVTEADPEATTTVGWCGTPAMTSMLNWCGTPSFWNFCATPVPTEASEPGAEVSVSPALAYYCG